MSETKQIKFQFVVDQGSAREVNRVLDEMIKKAQELGKALSNVGGGGGGGGLLGGARVGSGGASSQSTLAGKGGSIAQGKGSFTSVLTSNVDVFKKMAQEGGSAMRVMGDAVNRGITQQQRDINRLKESLEALVRTYDKVGGAGSGALGEKIQNKVLQLQQKIAAGQKELGKLESLRPPGKELMPEVPWPGKGGGVAEEIFSKLKTAIGGKITGAAEAAEGFGLSGVGGMIRGAGASLGGMSMGAMAGVAAAGAAAAASMYVAGDAAQKYAKFQGAESVDRRRLLDYQQMANQNLVGGMGMKIRAGNNEDLRAAARMELDPEKRQAMEETLDPTKRKGFFGTIGGYYRYGANRLEGAGEAWDKGGIKEWAGELFSSGDNAEYYKQGGKKRYAEMVKHEVDMENPFERMFADEMGANAVSKMAQMRALGMGGTDKHGAFRSNAERFLNARNQFDSGTVMSAFSTLKEGGTRRGAFGMIDQVLQAEAGAGISGAGSSAAIMGRQGGTAGGDFTDLLRSMAGKSFGMDPTVAGLLGNVVAGQADRMNLGGFNGAGLLGALSAGATGDDQAMIARQNIKGFQSFGNLLAGSRDPFQEAVNFQAARQSAPGAGYAAQKYLATEMDPARVAEIVAGTGHVTNAEKAMGLTDEMVKAQSEAVQKTQNIRVVPRMFKEGTEARSMADLLASGMSAKDAAKQLFAGNDGKFSAAEREKAKDAYGAILKTSGKKGTTLDEALGTANFELFGLGSSVKKSKDMAGDVASKSMERHESEKEKQIKDIDLNLKDVLATQQRDQGTLPADRAAAAYKRMLNITENTAVDAETIGNIMKEMGKKLRAVGVGLGPSAATQTVKKP
jgi:hypothetical protein